MSNNVFTGLIVAKVICCGGLILLASTGTLVGFAAWLSNNDWLVAAAIGLGVVALVFYLRPNTPTSEADPAANAGE